MFQGTSRNVVSVTARYPSAAAQPQTAMTSRRPEAAAPVLRMHVNLREVGHTGLQDLHVREPDRHVIREGDPQMAALRRACCNSS